MRKHQLAATLALGMFVIGGALASPRPDWPEVGRFDKKGRYQPPRRKAAFSKVHGEGAGVPRYPVILVHGQGGFVRLHIGKKIYGDYFNGVGKVYDRDGITYHATETDPFGTIANRAQQLKDQLLELGYEKVNLVGHSMGGLDARYMVTHLGMADRVASITTVGTPHHGSWYADWVLEWVFDKQKFWTVWDWLGIPRTSIPELTVKFLNEEFNPKTPDMPGIRYFSLGGHQNYLKTIIVFKGAKLVMQIIEKRVAGKKLKLTERVAEKVLFPKAMRDAWSENRAGLMATFGTDGSWVVPEVAGQNDCQVSVSSSMWGEYLGTLDADHFDQPGWFGAFRAPRFYRGIAHMLADAGY